VDFINVRHLAIPNSTGATLRPLANFSNVSQTSFPRCLILEFLDCISPVKGLADLLESDASCFDCRASVTVIG
jgi:hypothetical protein